MTSPGGIDITPDVAGRRPYGFGQIDSHDGTLYWTFEDVSIDYNVGLDSLDLVTDQILAMDIVGLVSDLVSSGGASDPSSVVVPEPATFAVLAGALGWRWSADGAKVCFIIALPRRREPHAAALDRCAGLAGPHLVRRSYEDAREGVSPTIGSSRSYGGRWPHVSG